MFALVDGNNFYASCEQVFQPALRERYKASGVELSGSTPEELAAKIQTDLVRWTELQKKAGVVPQ